MRYTDLYPHGLPGPAEPIPAKGGGALSASIGGYGTVVGSAKGAGALSAALAGSSDVAANLTAPAWMVAALSGVGTVSQAKLRGAGALSASLAGTSWCLGNFGKKRVTVLYVHGLPGKPQEFAPKGAGAEGPISATITGQGGISANLRGAGALAAALAGTSELTAAIAGAGVLSAAVSGTGSVPQAILKGAGALAATVAGTSTVVGVLTGLGIAAEHLGLYDLSKYDSILYDHWNADQEQGVVVIISTVSGAAWTIPPTHWAGKVHIA